jgi:short-subunit dehydrogenase
MLDHELASCGVRVMALCPKFMRTKFLNKPGDDDAARRMTRIGFEDVDRVVSKALRASLVGRPLCITSPDMRAAHVAAKLLPRRMLFLVEDLLFSRI